jgi:hypothetical protein
MKLLNPFHHVDYPNELQIVHNLKKNWLAQCLNFFAKTFAHDFYKFSIGCLTLAHFPLFSFFLLTFLALWTLKGAF